jgi:hypothetical protein
MTTELTNEQIKAALAASLGPKGDDHISYAYFADKYTSLGLSQCDLWSEFVDARERAAQSGRQIAKDDLPAQTGAILGQSDDDPSYVCRKNEHVGGHTWLFIDCDDGTSPVALRKVLRELEVNFLLTESATSRLSGEPLKWHLILPFKEHVIYASGVPTEKNATWWSSANAFAKAKLLRIGGITKKLDSTSDSFARLAYVPQNLPPESINSLIEGRSLDFCKFLAALGYEQPNPPTIEQQQQQKQKQEKSVSRSVSIGSSSSGPTPGESVGTLLKKVFEYEDRLGTSRDGNKYEVLCPWSGDHNGGNGQTVIDDSCVIFLDGVTHGGFKCHHNGDGCSSKTASDVLSWARRKGIPLPDRGVGGIGASELEAAEAAASEAAAPEVAKAEATAMEAEAAPAPQINVPAAFPLAPDKAAPAEDRKSQPQPVAKKELIEVGLNVAKMRDKAIKALITHPKFFVSQRDGRHYLCDLIRFCGHDGGMKTNIRKSPIAHVKAELSDCADWYVVKDGKPTSAPVHDGAVSAVLAAADWPDLKIIRGIINSPIFRRDGSILQTPGYDPASEIYYDDSSCKNLAAISPDPSKSDCAKALADLRYVLKDFPFPDPDLAFAVWLSAIFTRLMRFAFSGNVPMFAVDAGMSSSGKGLVALSAIMISTGYVGETVSGDVIKDDAEFDRRLGQHIAAGEQSLVLDNVIRGTVIGGSAIEAYFTSPVFSTRRIGTSDSIKQEKTGFTDLQIWATQNGLELSADMARRSLVIAINDKTGAPSDRKPTEKDLIEHCRIHRTRYLRAALTLLAGFYAARERGWDASLPPFASFDAWSIVRQAVVWCGLPDPFLARGKAANTPDDDDFTFLLGHMHKMIGEQETLVCDIADKLVERKFALARKFLSEKKVKVSGDGVANSLGAFIKKHKGKVGMVGGKRYQLCQKRSEGGSMVRLERVS